MYSKGMDGMELMHTGEQNMKIICHMRSSGHLCVVNIGVENQMNTKPWMMLVAMMSGWINRQQQGHLKIGTDIIALSHT